MIRDERIDLITISVKVAAHRELVLAALEAGKAVYCEAPLGRSVAEAEEMAGAAGPLHTAIAKVPEIRAVIRQLPARHSGEKGVHHNQFFDFTWELRCIGVRNHQTDVMPNDPRFADSEGFRESMNANGCLSFGINGLHIREVWV
jgi:hypothetical protein